MPNGSESYLHDPHKFADGGLQLRVPVDIVPRGEYSRLNNVVPKIEGLLQTRDGLTSIATVVADTEIHTIFRLNQEIVTLNGERLVGLGTQLFSAPLPDGDTFTELTGLSFDGGPLSIISFRFTNDQAAWAIIANADGMRKRKEGLYQKLGLPPPDTAATASDGGPGNLDSTGGAEFDWLYTYVNEVTKTESNPSPVPVGATEEKRPSTQDNPANVGENPWTDPANAYDNNPVTAATATVLASDIGGRTSIVWRGWAAATFTYAVDDLTLKIDNEIILTGSTGVVEAILEYSLDSGATFNLIFSGQATRTRRTDEVSIPAATDLTKIRIKATLRQQLSSGDRSMTWNIFEEFTLGGDGIASTLALVNRSANVCCVAPTDPQETAIRLYRRGGSKVATHFRVGEFPISTLVQGGCAAGSLLINDNIADSGLGDSITLDNDEPVSSVEVLNQPIGRIWGPFDERVLGCGDPNRPDAVYYSKRSNADAWPPQNFVDVSSPSDPLQNGVIYNTRSFVFSKEKMYELIQNLIGGSVLIAFATACDRGLISPWAVVSADAIYFVAKDGIYATTGGQKTSLVDNNIKPIFPTQEGPGRDVNGLEAVDMTLTDDIRLAYHNQELWFTYKGATTGTRQTLIYDTLRARWRAATYAQSIRVFHSEIGTVSNLLAGGDDGILYSTGGTSDDGSSIAVSLRTGAHDQGAPLNLKEYGNVLFDLDPGGATVGDPVTITPLRNGETITDAAIVVTGTGRQKVPLDLSDVFGFNLAFNISWTRTASIDPILFQYDILHRLEPARVKHWEARESSLGGGGFIHLRDAYIALRSTAAVTFIITFDGTAQSYTIPSTSGNRRKVYIPFDANKGKLYKFEFDSSAEFQLYHQDCEVRAKQWLTNLGYKILRPFGGEQGGEIRG